LWYYYHEGFLDKAAQGSWNEWFLSDKKRPLRGWMGNRKNYTGEFLGMVDDQIIQQESRRNSE
jgi:hypothetical protein